MARCPNKNAPEYKALQEVYKSEIATNNDLDKSLRFIQLTKYCGDVIIKIIGN